MKNITFILGIAAASFCTPIHAESLRCNGDLAQIGEYKASILYKCGEPFFAESYCRPRGIWADPRDDMRLIVLPCEQWDAWSYNPGPGQFITTLRFREGILVSISYGDRVR